MRYYEILYIVHSALEGGHLEDIIKSVDELIQKHGGKIETTDVWGKKRLAYLIEKESYGTYVLTQFSVDEPKNNLILEALEHNSNVLASLISKIEENEIMKDSKEEPVEETESKEEPAEETESKEEPAEETESKEEPAEETESKEEPAEETESKEEPAEETESKEEPAEETESKEEPAEEEDK